jgi:hypothetical protein
MHEKIEIPKEQNATLDGMQKVMYAKNSDGVFERFNYGSSVEEFATKVAVDEYETLKEECLKKISQGISSPIEYYMYENRMDLPTLSSAVAMLSFRVKRHLKMAVFRNMGDKLLSKYADVFGISVQDLKKMDKNG